VEAVKAAGKTFASIPWDDIEGSSKGEFADSWFMNLDSFTIIYGKILRLAAEKLDRVRTEAQKSLACDVRNSGERRFCEQYLISSYDYFRWLLESQTKDWLALPLFEYQPNQWRIELFEGYVNSADTGSEGLIRESRAALADFCERKTWRGASSDDVHPLDIDASNFVCDTVFQVAKKHIANDRVLVPTMEVMGFLFDAGIMGRSNLNWRSLYLLVQKAHYKTGNVRKLEAAIKLYGGLLDVYPEALQKLTSMLLHPFPNIRNQVAICCLWAGV